MSRYNTVLYNWTEITNRLMKNKQELAQFLRFSAGMYKQSFSDAALIYYQNPNATKVATLETWNRLGRLINKGEHSISVFGEGTSARHLFDITQTNGKKIPDLWKITEDIAGDITEVINDKYGKDCKNIQETIATISVDSIKGRLPDVQYAAEQMKLSKEQVTKYQQSLVSAVRFVVSNRCEIEGGMKLSGGINLVAADMFKDTRDLIRFCDIVQRSAKDALLEIEREIVQIQKRKREQTYERENEPDRSDPVRNGVHTQSSDRGTAEKTDRSVGQNVAGVDKAGISAGSTDIHNGGQVAADTATDRRRSGDTVSAARPAVPEGKSPSDDLSGNTGVGENAPADNRTSGDAGSRISVENVTPEILKKMRLDADFNRRLDNYEIAGWAFSDSEGTNITPIEFFNRFIADRYSVIQQQEIRDIMEAAIRNEKRLQQQSVTVEQAENELETVPDEQPEPIFEPEAEYTDEDEPTESEPVIINNSYIDTGLLPPMTDEFLINAIIKNDRFFKVKKDEIAAFFAENPEPDKRAEFMKTAINPEYSELDIGSARVGYKTFDNGLNIWEGNYLSRTKESGLSWDLVQSLAASLIEKGEYLDTERTQDKKPSRSSTNRTKDDTLVIYFFRMEETENKIYASCEVSGRKFETPVGRTEDDIAYIMDGQKPYKLNDYQTYDLEQFELYRSPIVHDKNGYFADDLDEGDNIRLDGEMWKVEKKTDNMIHLSRETDEGILDKHIYDNWQEALTQQGFEYIPEKAPVIDTPAPAKKKQTARKSAPAPISGGEQLSFFGAPVDMAEPAEPAKPKKREKLRLVYPATNVTPEMIDYALRGGSGKPQSLERIAYQFQLGKSDTENAEFLRKEFGTDGRGYFLPDETQLSAWFDNDGITLGVGVTAFNIVTKEHISWEDAAKRIGEMLANGEYCSQDIIDRSPQNEINDLAAQLWYIHQDIDRDSGIEYFIPEEMFRGGYPDSHNRIMADIADHETLSKYISGMEDFIRKYEENPDIMRFRFHKPKEALFRLKDLQRQRTEFLTKSDFEYVPKLFITEDEKDKLLLEHYGYRHGKFSIAKYFEQHEDEKERISFLKQAYGDGGSSSMGYDEWHDSKGIRYTKTDFSLDKVKCSILMKWNEVAERIERFIAEGKYITQAETEERIKDAKRDLERCDPTDFLEQYAFEQAKKVLDEYGIDYSDILAKKALTAENEKPVQEESEPEVTETAEIEHEPEMPETVQSAAVETQKQSAVFVNIEDDSFIYIGKTDTGLEYTMYAPDLTPVDGGVIDRSGLVDLRYEASFILDNSINDLAEIQDKEQFFELTELEYEGEVPRRLAELKAGALNNMPDSIETPEPVFPAEVEEEAAVFMDVRDETFISVMQVDEGIEYTLYASDLTPIDGGVWEMDEAMELSEAVAQLSGSEISNFVEITDYDIFFEIAGMNTELDAPAELAKLKSAAFESISQQTNESVTKEAAERAVFMDAQDETFIVLERKDGGIEYTAYERDLTAVDGGLWDTYGETPELKAVAAEFMATTTNSIIQIKDTEQFLKLCNAESIDEIAGELERLKLDSLPSILDNTEKTKTKENEVEAPVADEISQTEIDTPTADIPSKPTPEREEEKQTEPAAEEQSIEPAAEVQKQEKPAASTPVVNVPEIMMTPKKALKTGTPVTYHYHEGSEIKGAKAKFRANVAAIETLRKVEAENRFATPEEQAIMAKYSGWGGIPQAFTTDLVADRAGGSLGEAAPDSWAAEQAQLRALLTPDEYSAARESTLTSFYTPPEVTDCIYQALGQFGFEDGNILEPSMGVGNFFSKMPEEMHEHSKLYGVELDSISGRIAQMLYPEDRIQIKGFEQTRFNNNSFDVVIGNIPFGDYRVSDKAYDKLGFKIHDYFAAKSVDKVKPGGVVALVTSKFTMDKFNEAARRYLAERCDLLGAVRMPAGTFKDADSITTDILFLKKRDTLTVTVPEWVHMGQTEDGVPCNQYFVDNPDMVLGTMEWDERMRGKYGPDSKVTVCTADSDIPLAEQLKAAVAKIKGSIETVRSEEQEQGTVNMIPADPSVRNFTHTIVDGKLFYRENEVMLEVQETGKALERMIGMHNIRLAAMAVIDAQAAGCTDEELHTLQAELNRVYDRFRKNFGNITDSANERVFRHDDDYNTLAALEIIDAEKKTVEKSEIFTKRTILPEMEIMSVGTSQEALQVSLDRKGLVDIEYMASLVGDTPEKVIADLGSEIFRDPAKINDEAPYSGYVDASEYLSGNVREKLKIAQQFVDHIDECFKRNVTALQKVIPKDLEASEISVRIGANWIDLDDYSRFLRDYAQARTGRFDHPVTRTKTGEYKIEGKGQDRSVAATESYGTARMNSYQIFENLLNQRDIVIKDRVEDDEGKVSYVINPEATQLAKEKARLMKEGFKKWIWDDPARREKYVERYNYLFNAIRGREYDGSHQSFPGMNPAIKLRPHQENAVLRAKLGGNTLLAHCVGAGKSFEMIASAMEKKRLGLINKACVVVPKHLTLQTASEWMRLYPNAKLLVARPEDFTKDNRQQFIARCVTGDYDAVIMSFQQFERIPMSNEYCKMFMQKELDTILEALQDADKSDRVSIKSLERQRKKTE